MPTFLTVSSDGSNDGFVAIAQHPSRLQQSNLQLRQGRISSPGSSYQPNSCLNPTPVSTQPIVKPYPHSVKPRWRRRAAVAALLAATATPLALRPSVRAQPGPDGPLPFLEQLELAPEQQRQIRSIRETAQTSLRDRLSELHAERETLQALLAGTAPVTDIRSQFERVQTLRQEMAALQFENLLAIRAILTPEQRTLLSERISQHRERVGRRRGFGGLGDAPFGPPPAGEPQAEGELDES